MNKANKIIIKEKNRPSQPKSTLDELKKYIIWLPYKTNAVELVKKNR